MQVYYHLVFLVSILNPSGIVTESVKDVTEKNNISIPKSNNPTQRQDNFNLTFNKIVTPKKGKWHVGRVSRKQYEIINMLWRKTKIFIDTDTTKVLNNSLNTLSKNNRYKKSQHVTLVNHNPIQESFQLAHPKSKVYPSTSSYIEFYYLDELDERIKHNVNNIKNNKVKTKSEVFDKSWKMGMSRSPFFLFRVNEATCKATTPDSSHQHAKWSTSKLTKADNQKKTKRLKANKGDKINETTKSIHNSKTTRTTSKIINILLKQEIYKSSNKQFHDIVNKYTVSDSATAVNDHIRFFDIYDSYINTPNSFGEDDEDKMVNSNTIQNAEKVNLNQVDHAPKHDDKNKTRYVKKHVNHNKDYSKGSYELKEVMTVNNIFLNPTIPVDIQTQLPLWSDYPFVAVYVYEPTQVRCDSASISPHWLVASASCLNRHHKDIKAEGRSAYVAYCGGNWRHPGRIAYVKQSLIHPRFHPKDNTRRQLYNIGAIQVVNSMADTCNGWAPISLMSHQFSSPSAGTSSIALGWGLDRYDSTYSLTELPKHLTLYKGLVYTDSCPGNAGYSNARMLDEGSVKNVYCLSLPPYTVEENDTVHGSMLLIGGKLIALFMQINTNKKYMSETKLLSIPWIHRAGAEYIALQREECKQFPGLATQEERWRRGNQSAQYTGIWHLIPWLLDMAREPEELDPFSLDL